MTKDLTSVQSAIATLKTITGEDPAPTTTEASSDLVVMKMLITEAAQKAATKLYSTLIRGNDSDSKRPAFLIAFDALLLSFNDDKPLKGEATDYQDEDETQGPTGFENEDDDEEEEGVNDSLIQSSLTKGSFVELLMASFAVTETAKNSDLSPKQKEYQEFFFKKLEDYDAKSPADLDEDTITKFFNEIKRDWSGGKEEAALLANIGNVSIKRALHTIVDAVNSDVASVSVTGTTQSGTNMKADLDIAGVPYVMSLDCASTAEDLTSLDDRILASITRVRSNNRRMVVASMMPETYAWSEYSGKKDLRFELGASTFTLSPGSKLGFKKNESGKVDAWMTALSKDSTMELGPKLAKALQDRCVECACPLMELNEV